jgi:hypothetical protein
MAVPTEETSYHGNPNLKSIGYQHDFTKEQIKEMLKCKDDPIYFIETYCQIEQSADYLNGRSAAR